MGKGGMCASSAAYLEALQGEFGIDELLGLGLWGDSMPCNWDRSQSVHAFTLNIPGLEGKWGQLRFPVVVILKQFVVKHNTYDDMMAVAGRT